MRFFQKKDKKYIEHPELRRDIRVALIILLLPLIYAVVLTILE